MGGACKHRPTPLGFMGLCDAYDMGYPFTWFRPAVLVLFLTASCVLSAPLTGGGSMGTETFLAAYSDAQQEVKHDCVISIVLLTTT